MYLLITLSNVYTEDCMINCTTSHNILKRNSTSVALTSTDSITVDVAQLGSSSSLNLAICLLEEAPDIELITFLLRKWTGKHLNFTVLPFVDYLDLLQETKCLSFLGRIGYGSRLLTSTGRSFPSQQRVLYLFFHIYFMRFKMFSEVFLLNWSFLIWLMQ